MVIVRRRLAAVRAVLTDVGAEASICDAPDLLPSVLGKIWKGSHRPKGIEEQKWLFPYAVQMPGVQHIVDNAMKAALCTLSMWPLFLEHVKVCLFVFYVSHKIANPMRGLDCVIY